MQNYNLFRAKYFYFFNVISMTWIYIIVCLILIGYFLIPTAEHMTGWGPRHYRPYYGPGNLFYSTHFRPRSPPWYTPIYWSYGVNIPAHQQYAVKPVIVDTSYDSPTECRKEAYLRYAACRNDLGKSRALCDDNLSVDLNLCN